MTTPFLIQLIVLVILILLLIEGGMYVFYNYIYTPHKVRSAQTSFSELLTILNIIINTELDLYEKNIFTKKGALTNSNFENFYNDIVNNIINSISNDFFFRIGFYIKQEAVVSIICRTVKEYLMDRVNTVI